MKTGRRTFIVRCSDELIGNTEYFDKFYNYMEDVNVVKTFYEYLKTFKHNGKDMSSFRDMMNNPPRTEYEMEIRESNMSIPEQFLKNFTYKHINENNVEKTGKEFFETFTKWKDENNIQYQTTPQKLGVSISFLNLKGITNSHTREGVTKLYNIPLLKEHFKIDAPVTGTCLVTLPINEEIVQQIDDELTTDEEAEVSDSEIPNEQVPPENPQAIVDAKMAGLQKRLQTLVDLDINPDEQEMITTRIKQLGGEVVMFDDEVIEIEVNNKIYYTTDENDGIIYDTDENGDINIEVGKFQNGVPIIY